MPPSTQLHAAIRRNESCRLYRTSERAFSTFPRSARGNSVLLSTRDGFGITARPWIQRSHQGDLGQGNGRAVGKRSSCRRLVAKSSDRIATSLFVSIIEQDVSYPIPQLTSLFRKDSRTVSQLCQSLGGALGDAWVGSSGGCDND